MAASGSTYVAEGALGDPRATVGLASLVGQSISDPPAALGVGERPRSEPAAVPAPWSVPPYPDQHRLERRAGTLLRAMRDREAYRPLGFTRLGDYTAERLGISVRTVQEMMRTDEALRRLPRVARAFERGEITAGHVRLLTRAIDPEVEAYWVRLARTLKVKELAEALAADRRHGEGGNENHPLDSEPELNSSDLPGARAEPELNSPDIAAVGGAVGFSLPESVKPGPTRLDAGLEGADREEELLEPLEISAPAWVATMWRETIALARRLAGVKLRAGQCLADVLAEAASGIEDLSADRVSVGDEKKSNEPSQAMHGCTGDTTPAGLPPSARIGSEIGPGLRRSARFGTETPPGLQRSAPLGRDVGSGLPPSARDLESNSDGVAQDTDSTMHLPTFARLRTDSRPDLPPSAPDEPLPSDAEGLDAELRSLFTRRQRREVVLAEHLRLIGRDRGYRLAGFPSLEAYAFERFGLPARSLYYLLALHRALEALPELRRALFAGKITSRQALLLGKVGSHATLSRWVERATSVSFRRLDEEVDFWRYLREIRPAVWNLLNGGPLPVGLVIVPGEPLRLQESARSSRSGSPAERFLKALEAGEKATPLPARMTTIKMLVEPEVMKMWRGAVTALRASVQESALESITGGPVVQEPFDDWHALAILMKDFWNTWDNAETRRQRRRHPVLERDGWRCTAPGCSSMGSGRLQDHHVVFRSESGSDDESNRTTVCVGHHRLIHEAIVRVTGQAPDALVWEMGVVPGGSVFLIYAGETRIGGTAI